VIRLKFSLCDNMEKINISELEKITLELYYDILEKDGIKNEKRIEEIKARLNEISKLEVKQKVKNYILKTFGLDEKKLKKYRVSSSFDTIIDSMYFLKGLGIDVKKAVNRLPQLLTYSIKYMQERVEYLNSLGIDVRKVVNNLPALLEYSIKYMQERVDYLNSLGINVSKVVNKLPQLLELSVENNLKPKFKYLIEEVGLGIEDIETTPCLLTLSLEKRIKPRWEYIKSLGKDYVDKRKIIRCLILKEEYFKEYLMKI